MPLDIEMLDQLDRVEVALRGQFDELNDRSTRRTSCGHADGSEQPPDLLEGVAVSLPSVASTIATVGVSHFAGLDPPVSRWGLIAHLALVILIIV